jgi:small subunit ribosomal protein S17
MTTESTQKNTRPKILNGIAVSSKMKDTVVVMVERFVKHPRYGKYIKHRKKIKAHDVGNTVSVGDKVSIQETKPISKDKSFIVLK